MRQYFKALSITLFCLIANYAKAQNASYVYLEGIKNTPFSVQLDGGNTYNSNENDYLIISEVPNGEHTLQIVLNNGSNVSKKFPIQVIKGEPIGYKLELDGNKNLSLQLLSINNQKSQALATNENKQSTAKKKSFIDKLLGESADGTDVKGFGLYKEGIKDANKVQYAKLQGKQLEEEAAKQAIKQTTIASKEVVKPIAKKEIPVVEKQDAIVKKPKVEKPKKEKVEVPILVKEEPKTEDNKEKKDGGAFKKIGKFFTEPSYDNEEVKINHPAKTKTKPVKETPKVEVLAVPKPMKVKKKVDEVIALEIPEPTVKEKQTEIEKPAISNPDVENTKPRISADELARIENERFLAKQKELTKMKADKERMDAEALEAKLKTEKEAMLVKLKAKQAKEKELADAKLAEENNKKAEKENAKLAALKIREDAEKAKKAKEDAIAAKAKAEEAKKKAIADKAAADALAKKQFEEKSAKEKEMLARQEKAEKERIAKEATAAKERLLKEKAELEAKQKLQKIERDAATKVTVAAADKKLAAEKEAIAMKEKAATKDAEKKAKEALAAKEKLEKIEKDAVAKKEKVAAQEAEKKEKAEKLEQEAIAKKQKAADEAAAKKAAIAKAEQEKIEKLEKQMNEKRDKAAAERKALEEKVAKGIKEKEEREAKEMLAKANKEAEEKLALLQKNAQEAKAKQDAMTNTIDAKEAKEIELKKKLVEEQAKKDAELIALKAKLEAAEAEKARAEANERKAKLESEEKEKELALLTKKANEAEAIAANKSQPVENATAPVSKFDKKVNKVKNRANPNCEAMYTEEDLVAIFQKLEGKTDDIARVNYCRKLTKDKKCFSCKDLEGLSQSFTTQTGKFDFLKLMFPFVKDNENYEVLEGVFKFPNYKEKVRMEFGGDAK